MITKNFDQVAKDLEGNEIKDEQSKVLTLKIFVIRALLLNFDEEKNLPGEEKLKRFELAQKIHKGGNINLEPEEIIIIKNVIARAYSPLIVGLVYQILK